MCPAWRQELQIQWGCLWVCKSSGAVREEGAPGVPLAQPLPELETLTGAQPLSQFIPLPTHGPRCRG